MGFTHIEQDERVLRFDFFRKIGNCNFGGHEIAPDGILTAENGGGDVIYSNAFA
jgi:hypothetical protein